MNKRLKKQLNSGFTLVETLAVVAIVVILLGLSTVGVVYYMKYLKITELDNAARDIYMAAENRAVLLRSGSQLDPILEGGNPINVAAGESENDAKLYYVTKEKVQLNDLLTTGAIDPALLDGDFYIIYERNSGSVTDVFYTEENNGFSGGNGKISEMIKIAGDRNKRMNNEPMLGYYGGENAGSLTYDPLEEPQVEVIIHNEEVLWVEVKFTVPEDMTDLISERKVELTYGDKNITLFNKDKPEPEYTKRMKNQDGDVSTSDGKTTYTYIWALDALDYDAKESDHYTFKDMHFRQLFDDGSFGGDFSVSAYIKLSSEGHKSSEASDSDANNSLFAKESTEDTAKIECLRHLQNLDTEISKVGEKITKAVQSADIECSTKNEVYKDYEFVPIVNDKLESFEAEPYVKSGSSEGSEGGNEKDDEPRYYEIRELHVTKESAKVKTGAGLFAESSDGKLDSEGKIESFVFKGARLIDAKVEGNENQSAGALLGVAGKYCRFENVCVVDASVEADVSNKNIDNIAAGGIVGGAENTDSRLQFDGCRVYWKLGDKTNLRDTLGSDKDGYEYQISGITAGGLAGMVNGKVDVKNSFAATLVSGKTAGGLIGKASGEITIGTSYADCYLEGMSKAGTVAVGGLIGQANKAKITDAYSAGFIDGKGVNIDSLFVGGILGSSTSGGNITAPTENNLNGSKNVYAAMSYTNLPEKTDENKEKYKEHFTPGVPYKANESTHVIENCYFMLDGLEEYLGRNEAESNEILGEESYAEMISDSFITTMGDSFVRKDKSSTVKGTYPYNLQVKQNLTVYRFPGLKGLPHYGDWVEPIDLGEYGLYYWEELVRGNESEPTYHFSILAVHPDKNKIIKNSTLSTLHDEGGKVVRYGYGVYNKENVTIKLESGNDGSKCLLYSGNGSAGVNFAERYIDLQNNKGAEDKKVDEALAELGKDGKSYKFYSFHSYGVDETPGGLYPQKDNANCVLTLKQSDDKYATFMLSPFFADAMSVSSTAGNSNKWILESKLGEVDFDTYCADGKQKPGHEENPYEVRSITQLRMINWNSQNMNTDTVMDENNVVHQEESVSYLSFPYLNCSEQKNKYYWQQTYDLDGKGEAYSPIAEYNDTSDSDSGEIKGWFGGSYDGGGYVIKDMNIQGQTSSSVGLFGVVYDGSLKNIVLCSSTGNGTISTQAGSSGTKGNEKKSKWISMGALAGVVGTQDSNNVITNCAVSGYTINVNAETLEVDADVSQGTKVRGGVNIGGLVGSSHMNLSGCSSVVDIVINGLKVHDNVHVGGLAGVCQGNVTQCYAGGEITLGDKNKINVEEKAGIYIGGLVGGSYVHPLEVINDSTTTSDKYIGQVNGTNDVELTDCYSYVKLPCITAHKNLWGLYAIGGTGEIDPSEYSRSPKAVNFGVCTMSNCYYLENEVLANNWGVKGNGGQQYNGQRAVFTILGGNGSKATKTDMNYSASNPNPSLYPIAAPVSYEQLSGIADIDAITGNNHSYVKATKPDGDGEYRWVDKAQTSLQSIYTLLNAPDAESNPVFAPGQYSYPPDGSSELKDKDYPFPTIITKDEKHVHYGRWPLSGFYRVDIGDENKYLGIEPIEVDLIVDDGKVHKEMLVLSENTKGTNGEWKVERIGGGIADATIDKNSGDKITLTVTGKDVGTVPLKITYTENTAGKGEYSLTVMIHVTAYVGLEPSTVYMFPNDEVTVKLAPVNAEGEPLNGGVLTEVSATTTGSLTATIISAAEQSEGGATGNVTYPAVKLTTNNAAEGSTSVNVEFDYTGDGVKYNCQDIIDVHVMPAPKVETKWETEGITETLAEGGAGKTTKRAVSTIIFPDYNVMEGGEVFDTLTFLTEGAEIISKSKSNEAVVEIVNVEKDGKTVKAIRLTYPWETVEESSGGSSTEALEIQLQITLTMDSKENKLIPLGGAQKHTLTINVPKPEADKPVEEVDEPVTETNGNNSGVDTVTEAGANGNNEMNAVPPPAEDGNSPQGESGKTD